MDITEIESKANAGQFSIFDMETIIPELNKLEDGDIYLEIGVDRGRSLSVARMATKDGVKIYGVDIVDNLNPSIPNTTFIRGDSLDVAANWKDKISILFIDGNHWEDFVTKDISAWLPHMKDDGLIFFHDYDETSPGVVKAVNNFITQYPPKEFKQFKAKDKNTSMALVRL